MIGRALPLFQELGIDLPNAPIPKIEMSGIDIRFGSRQLTVVQPNIAHVFDRPTLDAWLVGEARKQGVEIAEEWPVRTVTGRPGDFTLSGPDGKEIRAKCLIGADGVGGIIRKQFVEKTPKGLSHLVQVEVPIGGDSRELLRFDFTPITDGINGYAWLFPEIDAAGAPVAKIGIYDRGGRAKIPLREYCIQTAGRWGYAADLKSVKHWSFREYAPKAKYSAPGVLLAGDAAGADPLVAEGIRQAVMWGTLAGEHAATRIGSNDWSLKGYERVVAESELGIELRRNLLFANLLYSPLHSVGLWTGFTEPRILEKVFEWVAGSDKYKGMTAAQTAVKAVKAVGKGIARRLRN